LTPPAGVVLEHLERRASRAAASSVAGTSGSAKALDVRERLCILTAAASVGPRRSRWFTLADRPFIAFNSPIAHGFDFTPSMSIFVTCDTPGEVDELFGELSSDGSVLMPLDDYGFSPRFGWCTDRHGVSWQVGCT
jgi:hypothetical protein